MILQVNKNLIIKECFVLMTMEQLLVLSQAYGRLALN